MASTDDMHVAHGDTLSGESTHTLNPVGADEKTWGWFAIFNIWANDVQSLFGYSLVASLFISYGVGGWTAFAALIFAGLFVMWMVNLSGAAGERYGIPYPVFARASLGTAGSNLPAILRATVAVFWYGVQVYFRLDGAGASDPVDHRCRRRVAQKFWALPVSTGSLSSSSGPSTSSSSGAAWAGSRPS